jgi:lysozyme
LWGAYHFATGGDGVAQAEHFLQVVGNFDNTLLVLDFEQNPSGSSMSLDDARNFVTHVNAGNRQVSGFVFRVLYQRAARQQQRSPSRSVLVLVAQYGPTAVVPVNWTTWTMWQYTDGAVVRNRT